MKTKPIVIFLFTFLVLFAGCGEESSNTAMAAGPDWKTYDQGMKQARSQDKHVMINFYADWCQYCKQMDENTFKDAKVLAALKENFVAIKVDTEAERSLASDYYVRGLPTIWFLKSDGEKLAPIPGYVPPEQFVNILKYVSTKSYETMSFREFMEKNGGAQ